MDAVFAETLKIIVGGLAGGFGVWLFSRRKEKADLMVMATEAAKGIMEQLRTDVDELREQRAKDQKEIASIKTMNHKFLCVLKRWAIGLRLIQEDYQRRDVPMPWTPSPEDLEMVENE